MKFSYILETVNKNGLTERTVKEFDKETILFGRGTSADVLLMNRMISLSHAKLTLVEDALVIEDLESLSGILVNGTLVSRQRLKLGDRVKLGGFVFDVVSENEHWGFLEQRKVATEVVDTDSALNEQYRKLRFQSYLPSFTVLSSVLGGLVLILFLILPLAGKNKLSWNSGPISNAHRMLENQCESCHASAFRQVRDEQCTACHSMTEHSKNLSGIYEKHAKLNMRCGQCHMEHNGTAGIIAKESKLCTDCHANLETLLPGTEAAVVESFPKHPNFRVTLTDTSKTPQVAVGGGSDAAAVAAIVKRVSLDDKINLVDPTQLKLNHKIHLQKDIAGATGPVTLGCNDCHKIVPETGKILPIKFQKDCASCHNLEFDDKLPGKSVPHGNPDTVFNFLYAEYARLFLIKDGVEDPNAGAIRRKPGQEANRGEEVEFSRASVEAQSRSVEESLFTRTACHLCHVVEDVPPGTDVAPNGKTVQRISKYRVVPAQVPDRWMPASTFNHSAHQEVACESCHNNVRTSEKTADVLLPGIDNCVQCHEGGLGHRHSKGKGMVVSECIMCHSYHDQLPMKEDTKRNIQEILMSSIAPFDRFSSASSSAEGISPVTSEAIRSLLTATVQINGQTTVQTAGTIQNTETNLKQ